MWPTFHGIGEEDERVDVVDRSLELLVVGVVLKIRVRILGM
jgi:hypothetical protein